MQCECKQLCVENGIAEYNMLQDIGQSEYGFTNEVNGMSYAEYRAWLVRENEYAQAKNLPANWIPQTTYFLYVQGVPVGVARIRHYASEYLENQGVGSFGYGIAKAHRGKGYGKILFACVLEKCKAHGYDKIKSFVDVDNAASNRIFAQSGAVLLGKWHETKNIYEITIT